MVPGQRRALSGAVPTDKIYRNRKNLQYCKEHGICLSGPALGRPKKGTHPDHKFEYIDNPDSVEIERAFSLWKRSFGLGLIRMKFEAMTRGAIVLPILSMNLSKVTKAFWRQKLEWIFSRYRIKIHEIIGLDLDNNFGKAAVVA
jgi:IS5 family transposase